MALGAVQGVAEVVPVSSSAQLVLLPWLAGWAPPEDRTTFGAALHAGSCLGICWSLRHDLRALTVRELAVLAAVSVPAAAAGAVAADAVEERLGRPPQLAGLLAAAGALMWWVDARAARRPPAAAPYRRDHQDDHVRKGGLFSRDHPDDHVNRAGEGEESAAHRVRPRQAALAGLAQTAALVPGVSRSGATLTALRAAGVARPAAERFSLLMSLPITAGAAGLTLARARSIPPGALPGAAAAAVAGALAVRRRPGRSLAGPAIYRLGLAAVVARRLVREGAVP